MHFSQLLDLCEELEYVSEEGTAYLNVSWEDGIMYQKGKGHVPSIYLYKRLSKEVLDCFPTDMVMNMDDEGKVKLPKGYLSFMILVPITKLYLLKKAIGAL